MSRLTRAQIRERITQRFPGSEVTVDREPGGLRIEMRWEGGDSVLAITGSKPGVILRALLGPREEAAGAPVTEDSRTG